MKIISRDFGRSLINPLEISKSRADRLLSSWLSQKARVSSRIPNKFALMHPRGCNGLHAICKCVGQVAFQRFLRIPLVTTLPPIFFARFVRLTLAEWTFQSWLTLGRRFKEEYYYYYYWKFIKLRMYYWNLRRMFSTSCTILKRKGRKISSSIRAIEFSAILRVQKIGVSPITLPMIYDS